MKEQTHTPTPWNVSSSTIIIATEDKRDLAIICNTMDLMGISGIGVNEARANAAHIVHCVNHHEKLVGALKTIIATEPVFGMNPNARMNDPDHVKARWNVHALARAALTASKL